MESWDLSEPFINGLGRCDAKVVALGLNIESLDRDVCLNNTAVMCSIESKIGLPVLGVTAGDGGINFQLNDRNSGSPYHVDIRNKGLRREILLQVLKSSV